ncbi:MAG: putative transporter [Prevotellaceae bacterium]|jgi:putative transport protein|nr:putative transporter [Prevotellaceae bacterium]
MDWFISLFTDHSIAHTILLYALVISAGVMLGKIKIRGVSLGVTWVLFVGIIVGHFGLKIDEEILHFIKEFGLILFVFSIGLQVGPSFFSSFKKGGIQMNMLAVAVVFLGVGVAVALHFIFAGKISMAMMTGILSGAVTNTPALGAAQEALRQLSDAGQISETEPIALGYAVAYPLGVIGAILAILLIRYIFWVNFDNENRQLETANTAAAEQPEHYTVCLTNPALANRQLDDVKQLVGRKFVVSRMKRGGEYFIPLSDTPLLLNDILRIVSAPAEQEAITVFVGKTIEEDWKNSEGHFVSRRIVITQDNINGRTLGSLRLRSIFGVNITRVHRSGIDLLATPNLVLQVGDRVMVVGEEPAIKKVEKLLGNTLKRLSEPHIVTIFIGIFAGILLGSIPFTLPNMPMPVKLGLAGGPLIIAIFIGRFGYKMKLITYTTRSANLMLREIGICLFLTSVGIGAGDKFVESVISGNGLLWLLCGFLITVVPLLSVGIFARKALKMNYFVIMGMLAGSSTNPPALAYANTIASNDTPAVAYSTVYPLTMFLRILAAQLLILIFV